MEKLIESPITGNTTAQLEEIYAVDTIKRVYHKFGIDVAHFFESLNEVYLFKCTETGYRFYYPFSIFADAAFYEKLQQKDPNYYPTDKWEYDYAIDFIQPGMNVLEIGCGEGHFLTKCQHKRASVHGLEFNPEAVKVVKGKGFAVKEEMIDAYSKKNHNTFDIVCAFQVLEHVYEPGKFIRDCLYCLKPGGKLILGVPNSNPYIYRYDQYHTLNLPPHHAGLWNKFSLEKIARYYPIEVEAIKISPLEHYKDWFKIRKDELKKRGNLYRLLDLIPRPIYKLALHVLRNRIEGKTIVAVYQKRQN